MTQLNQIKYFSILLLAVLMGACTQSESKVQQTSTVDEAKILLEYLEENSNVINQQAIPYLTNAEEVFANLKASNYHVIDIRQPREYKRGHIENAVNIQAEDLLGYFENKIEPNSFEKIVLACDNAQHSGYATAILHMLGYTNTSTLRFGMSSWHESIARRHWHANLSDELEGRLETAPHPKKQLGQLPELNTGESTGYDILRKRAQQALEVNWDEISIHYLDIMEQVEEYYVINYWPEALYSQGHLPGATQYTPKKSLHSTTDLLTIPTNQPVVTYCFTGHHGSWANAFLGVMGYDIRSLEYGANGFIHHTMHSTQTPTRSFSDIHVKNFPLVTEGLQNMSNERSVPSEKVEVTTAQGGC